MLKPLLRLMPDRCWQRLRALLVHLNSSQRISDNMLYRFYIQSGYNRSQAQLMMKWARHTKEALRPRKHIEE